MYEVELKVGAAHDVIRPLLEERGAERLGCVRQEDTYFDAPHRNFEDTDEALRVRHETPDNGPTRTLLTYKGPLVDAESKTREEAETTVGDGEALAAVLAGLGFEPAATVRKDRERFALDDYVVTLDAVDGLGEFLEVETETAQEGDVKRAREGAAAVLESLDLDPDDGIRTSYLGMLLAEETARERDEQ